MKVDKSLERLLRRLRSDKVFRERIVSIRSMLVGGDTLRSARSRLGIKSERYWNAIEMELANYIATPESFFHEWQLRHRSHINIVASALKDAEQIQNPGQKAAIKSKIAMDLARLNMDEFDTYVTLGCAQKFIEHNENSKNTIDVKTIDQSRESFHALLDDYTRNTLDAERRIQDPESVQAIDQYEPSRKTNRLEQTTLVAVNPTGQVPKDCHTQSQPNGVLNVLHPMVPVASKDKPST